MEEGLWILTSALCGRSLRPSKTGAGCGCNNSGGKEKKILYAGRLRGADPGEASIGGRTQTTGASVTD